MNISELTIDEVLRSEDIESLFQHGAPENEYTPEVQGILKALALMEEQDITEERLIAIVQSVWVRMLGPFSEDEIEMRMPAFRKVAHRMLNTHS